METKKRDESVDSCSRRQFLRAGASLGLIAPFGSALETDNATQGGEQKTPDPSDDPQGVRNLIIYEIATKGFTSPHGPESGTFNSLRARLPYLENLGITAIWLTGYSLCDAHHFYNIWTQYAVIEPAQIDPSLGTEQEFKSLITEAHQRGIKIFLDVITHGLMSNSPIISKHPNWFQGSSWGMADFDWYGGHTDLDDWWVKVWTDYVVKFGVDGFRLDVFIYRPDLWARIRQNAAAARHPIVVFEEADSPIPGVTDFSQHENTLPDDSGSTEHVLNQPLLQDVPGFYRQKFGKAGNYDVEVQFQDDGTRVKGDTQGQGTLHVRLDGLGPDKITRRRQVFFTPMTDGIPDVQLTIENLPNKPIENIVVRDDIGGYWELNSSSTRHLVIERPDRSSSESGGAASLRIYVATLAHGWPTLQLSCHDNGWEGFPLNKNPYVAQGSRALFGYSCLFTPMVPVFFSGEEFNATFRPLPSLSPFLYGGKDAGKGRWLYGSMIDWNEIDEAAHKGMLEDVKAMIAVRRREADVLAALPEKQEPNLMAVPHESSFPVPIPYVRWKGGSAILVVANRNAEQDVQLKLQIPLREMGLAGQESYKVTQLWPRGETRTYKEADMAHFTCTVKRDKTAGGGVCVFKIERAA